MINKKSLETKFELTEHNWLDILFKINFDRTDTRHGITRKAIYDSEKNKILCNVWFDYDIRKFDQIRESVNSKIEYIVRDISALIDKTNKVKEDFDPITDIEIWFLEDHGQGSTLFAKYENSKLEWMDWKDS